jgi:hypothetical protein
MKNYIILGIFAIVFAGCNSKPTENNSAEEEVIIEKRKDLDMFLVNCPIESLIVKYYDVFIYGEDTVNLMNYGNEYNFNEDGNFVNLKNFIESGMVLSETKYKYDKDGNFIGNEVFGRDGNLLSYCEIVDSDIKSKKIKSTYDSSGVMISESELYQDEYGRTIREVAKSYEQAYVLDDKNRIVESLLIYQDRTIDSKLVYEFNDSPFPEKTCTTIVKTSFCQ